MAALNQFISVRHSSFWRQKTGRRTAVPVGDFHPFRLSRAMIKARIAFNLHSPINSSLHNPCSPPSICPPSLRLPPSPDRCRRRLRRIQIGRCSGRTFDSSYEDDSSNSEGAVSSGSTSSRNASCRSINAATWVGVATLTSKILGLIREIVMASVFGVGPVATAFKYAWVLPGFSASLLGGVNGPIHVVMASTLSKLPKDQGKKLFKHLTTIMLLIGGLVGTLVYIFPEFVIHIYAPGFWILEEGRIIRETAIEQLKIMTPCIALAGPVGLGFGCLSAEGNNALPSISPALSSMLLIASCLIYTFTRRLNASLTGGSMIAVSVSLGLFLQWIIQVVVLRRGWSCIIPDSLVNILTSGDVHEFFSMLLPATLSSGMAQIASFTDLSFASLIPGAAAGLSYAYLMIMAPLGALSSIIVLPCVTTFSKLVKARSFESLEHNIEIALLLCMVILLPIFSVMRVLAEPIVHVLFERFAFDSSASTLVSTLFLAYSLGAPFLIGKDLLVAGFYALGDGKTPLLVSAGAVALNAILDWLSVSRFNLGAMGLALSTSFTAAMSFIILFHLLKKKLPGLSKYAAMVHPSMLFLFCCITSNLITSMVYNMICKLLSAVLLSRYNLMKHVFAISISGALGVIGFFLPIFLLYLAGFDWVRDLYRMMAKPESRIIG